MFVARHAQITQSKKFATTLKYLKKEVSNEVDFLHTNKHESFLQTDTITSVRMDKHSRNSQNRKFAMSLQYLVK